MILCDSNIWLALALSRHGHHGTAREWLISVAEPASVFFCRATQQSLVRLLSSRAVFGIYGNPPLTNNEAWSAYEAFIADDRITLRADEPAGLEPLWKQFALRKTASPKLWMDAYLAAFASASGYCLVTTDGAFRQFVGLDLLILGAD